MPHRQVKIRTIGKISFINDSKATNQESTLQALRTFENIYLILGGIAKSEKLDIILPYFNKVKHSFLIGSSTDVFSKILSEKHLPFTICKNLEDATQQAYFLAKTQDAECNVLLSPACASWDQFNNFEHRGNIFADVVNKL